MATTLRLEAPWPEVKELLKESSPLLTDADLVYMEGKEEQLLQRLAAKMGRSEEQVKAWIESVSANKGKAS